LIPGCYLAPDCQMTVVAVQGVPTWIVEETYAHFNSFLTALPILNKLTLFIISFLPIYLFWVTQR